ncbi:uncharacterized protein LOC119729814 [Patiria miniata]|uniref:C-type lectin domain-containing protein n=1 Tax=Patiria miniata TaxID=46514 RepID=A0A914A3W1_PATMI|nr:uncharacterized protein LOC119729814 [Patiria miniata]
MSSGNMSTAVAFLLLATFMIHAAAVRGRHVRSSPDMSNLTYCVCQDVERISTTFEMPCRDCAGNTTMSCYRLVNEMKNFTEARRACCDQGGHLVYIETGQEREFLQSTFPGAEDYWAGFNGSAWLDGSARTETAIRISGNSNCFAIARSGNSDQPIRLKSESCAERFQFMCELPMVFESNFSNWSVNDYCNCSKTSVTSTEPDHSDLMLTTPTSEILTGTSDTRETDSTVKPALSTDTVDTYATVATTSVDNIDGEPDGVTTPNDERTGTESNKELTTVGEKLSPNQRQTGGPIGVPIGVTLAVIVILAALVAFYFWRKRGKNRGEKSRGSGHLMAGEDEVKSPLPVANPTYSYQENGHVADINLHPVTTSGLPNKDTAFGDDESPDYTPYPNNEADSYATIPSSGYTAYKPQQENGVYTGLTGTKEMDDDPAVYTPIPNNGRKPSGSSESEYVDPEPAMEPRVTRHGASGVGSPLGQASGRKQAKDSGYVDVDAPQSLGGVYMDLDDDVNGQQGRQPARNDEYTYVSVDGHPVTISDSQDEDPEGDYYFKLEKPGPDDSDPGTDSQTDEEAPGGNDYDTFNRAGAQHPRKNAPTDVGTYNLPRPTESNAYDTFNRAGDRQPKANCPTPDEGVYSLPGAPADDVYSTLN